MDKCSFLENSNYRRTEINPAHQHFFLELVKMTLGLYMVPTAYQTVKLTSLCTMLMCHKMSTTIVQALLFL